MVVINSPINTGSFMLSSAKEISKCLKTFDTTLLSSKTANLCPMPEIEKHNTNQSRDGLKITENNLQFLGPAEKGRYEKMNFSVVMSSRKRSGLNSNGFGNSFGWRPNVIGENPILQPFGNVCSPEHKILF